MIGQTIDAKPGFSPLIAMLGLVGVVLLGLAAAISNVHVLLLAIVPLCMAISLVFGRPQPMQLLVENDGLRLLHRPEKILYQDVRAVTVNGREYGPDVDSLPAAPFEIHCHGVSYVVPPVMNVPRIEFYRFLRSRYVRPPRPVPAVLADYLKEQVAKFGPSKVDVIHKREALHETWQLRRRRWLGIGLLIAGVILFAVAMSQMTSRKRADEFAAWSVAGISGVVIGVVCWAWPRAGSRSPAERLMRKHPDACVVIGPAGIAIVQADTKGASAWHEVLSASSKFSQFLRTSRVNGVQLRLRGAEILIFDIYERSPTELAEMIRRNLEPGIR